MLMTIVIKFHLVSYYIFYVKMTLFEMSLLWATGRIRSNNVIFALKMTQLSE